MHIYICYKIYKKESDTYLIRLNPKIQVKIIEIVAVKQIPTVDGKVFSYSFIIPYKLVLMWLLINTFLSV